MSVLAKLWSFILTLVRSLIAFFSFRRRTTSDPFSLPTPNDAVVRAHSRLRPIVLTPRSVQNTRTHSATSTLYNPTASEPQRTSPKLDPHDAELGLPVTSCEGPPAASASSSRECTDDSSGAGSLYVLPLTPPDRCYLAPLPSTTDCPYTEPWPATLDHDKPKLPGSPLKLTVDTIPPFPEPMVAPIGSPPPGHWSPVQVWTSTPCKSDPVSDALEQHNDLSSALVNLSHAIISRSQSSFQAYDDASNSSVSSDAIPLADYASRLTRDRYRPKAHVPRTEDQPFRRFHHPDAYAYTWRRLPARLPGKLDRTHAHAHSHSHTHLSVSEWYNSDAYAPSPHAVLSPPKCDSATDEEEDEMPLGRLRERLARRSLGPGLDMPVPIGTGKRRVPGISPRTRRMSEGCLLALSEGTPTRVGVGARAGRQALSVALDGDGYGTKDWLEALSLRFSSEHNLKANLEPPVSVEGV